jgi:adenylate kinase
MPAEVVTKAVRTPMSTAVNLVLLGPPGSGKGTQAVRLAEALGVPAISTGDILRKAVHDGSPIGRAVKAVMERGELISDGMMTDIVAARLHASDAQVGCVLDGFPRTVDQAVALDRLMVGRGHVVVAELAVPEAALIRRLTMRRVCEQCGVNAQPEASLCRCGGSLVSRADDREDVARERLRVYERATRPLVDFYSARRVLHAIDGTLAPHAVTARIRSAIDARLGLELQQTTVCE